MSVVEIKQDIFCVGAKDWNLTEFHGYATPRGSTYNAYVVLDEKNVLIDGVKFAFSDENIERIKEVVSFSALDYIVVNHVEMDHSGNIPEIVRLAPQAKIVTNIAGKKALAEHFDTTGWSFKIVKTGDSISIGKKTLSFVTTPMLHWPDSMMTYIKEAKVLFSNDGFGQHYCTDTVFAAEANLDIVCSEAKKYYANILFPLAMQTNKALKTAYDMGLDIEMIAPSHGCIWNGKEEVATILDLYASWASGSNKGKAVVVYDTMWGSTETLADVAVGAFELAGIPVTKHCLTNSHISEVIVDFMDAEYVLIGSPTLNNELFPRVASFVTYMKGLQPKNKKAFAFGSYGWKSGVLKQVELVFDALGWEKLDALEVKYRPKSQELETMKNKVNELIDM